MATGVVEVEGAEAYPQDRAEAIAPHGQPAQLTEEQLEVPNHQYHRRGARGGFRYNNNRNRRGGGR